MNISRWLPFKFFRKKKEADSRSGSTGVSVTSPGAQAVGWSDPARLLQADPLRVMQEMLRDPFAGFGQLDRWFGDHSPATFHPQVDIVDDGRGICVSAELPGVDKDDIDVSLEEGALSLRGQKRVESSSEEEGCYRTERAYGYFHRIIPLPSEVDVDAVEAQFDKGVLTVRIPKMETSAASSRRITVR
jgi:HSP20 family protein